MDYKIQVFLLIWAGSVIADPVCDKDLGCFDNNYPWFTLLRPFPYPMSREEVNTRFFFSNRYSNKSLVQTWPTIKIHPEFDPEKPTYFITHGFISTSNEPWFKNMSESILYKTDGNVFSVDWGKGASGFYLSAAANTRTVAAEIIRVINYLVNNNALDVKKLHLLGHSLGAHIMSYVGKNFTNPKIYRITALDPAQPGFQYRNPLVRLNQTDADLIDVVHTDGRPFLPFLGFGITTSVGDIDFFVNGGESQPNCVLDGESFYKSFYEIPKITIDILYNLVICNHIRAPRYMAAAIKEPCHMWGHRYTANSASLRWTDFVINDQCDANSCSVMSLDSFRLPARGNFAFNTSGTYPFCKIDAEAEEKMKQLLV